MKRLLNIELMRFGIVGGTVAAAYVVAYLALLHIGVAQVAANAVAFLLAIVLQYAGQAIFTFRRDWAAAGQMLRFGVMTGLGFAVSALITGFVGPKAGLTDAQAALVVVFWLPIQNYIIMKIWVFSGPYKGQETT